MHTAIFTADDLRVLVDEIFRALGTPEDIADVVARHLVQANLAGHDSHGVQSVPMYVEAIRQGELVPDARPDVEPRSPGTALVNGNWGVGHYVGAVAMDEAIRLAAGNGIGMVGIVRINHLGRMGSYIEQANNAGVPSLTFVSGLGGPTQAVPYGGTRAAYGANPFAAGFPSYDGNPLLLDYATTAMAGGKVQLARSIGQPLPEGVLLDGAGRPTTDPEDLYRGGALLPFGGHKGYSLALLVELLGRTLSGARRFSHESGGGRNFAHAGATFIAIDAAVFHDREEVLAEAAETLEQVRANPPAPGFERVLTPGEPEQKFLHERQQKGIPVPSATVQAIATAVEEAGIDSPAVKKILEPSNN